MVYFFDEGIFQRMKDKLEYNRVGRRAAAGKMPEREFLARRQHLRREISSEERDKQIRLSKKYPGMTVVDPGGRD